jgi:hypothetical protein
LINIKKNNPVIRNWVKNFKLSTIVGLFLIITQSFYSVSLWAWGAKGHAVICEAAIHLVKNPALKSYLLHKTHNMSHLCNVPDIYWRQLPGSESGNSTHFIEPDLVGSSLEESPTVIVDFVTKYQNKISVINKNPVFFVEKEVGSLWWRADQFIKLAIESGKTAKSLNLPELKDQKNDDHPYNKAIFEMITRMGLLGHFVGDASQPLHNTSNYDGWENGHGGVHSYYEEMVVVRLRTKLLDQIIKNASKSEKILNLSTKSTYVDNMKKLSIATYKDLPEIWKLDPIEKKSTKSESKDISLKQNAIRTEASIAANSFEPLIIKEMSLSAVLLAFFWDQIYTQAQMPNLETYKGYRFPFQPEFIEPDYIKTIKHP